MSSSSSTSSPTRLAFINSKAPPPQPTQTINNCNLCASKFSLIRSRKHCGNCGNLICSDCSQGKAFRPNQTSYDRVRVCDYCVPYLTIQNVSRDELQSLPIKTLSDYIKVYDLPAVSVIEKEELVRIISKARPINATNEAHFRTTLPRYSETGQSWRAKKTAQKSGTGIEAETETNIFKSFFSSVADGWSNLVDELTGEEEVLPRRTIPRPSQPSPRPSQPPPRSFQPPPAPRPQPRTIPEQPQGFPQGSQPHMYQQAYNGMPNFPSFSSFVPQSHTEAHARAHAQATAQATAQAAANAAAQAVYESTRAAMSANAAAHNATNANPSSMPARASSPSAPPLSKLMADKTDPATLSVSVLKAILKMNGVSIPPHLLEKSELVKRVQELLDQARKEREEELKGASDKDICKICWDSVTNSVLMDCGHMATCLDCGNALKESTKECPICRARISRVVRVFRS